MTPLQIIGDTIVHHSDINGNITTHTIADSKEFKTIHATILSCIDLLGKSGENTKAIVAEKLKGLIEGVKG